MKQYTSDQILEEFGNMILFEHNHLTSLFDQLKYISGFMPFNKFIYSNNFDENNHVIYFNKRVRGLEIVMERGPFQSRTGLPFGQINYIVIESAEEMTEKNNNCVAGRACRNGHLTGKMANTILEMFEGRPIKEGRKSNKYPDNILTISYNDGKQPEAFILFGVSDKNSSFVKNFFSIQFRDKFKNAQAAQKIIKSPLKEINTLHIT